MRPEDRLAELGLTLPAPPPPLGDYELSVQTANLLFSPAMRRSETVSRPTWARSGAGSASKTAGRRLSTACNMLATLAATLGELSRVRRVVKLFGMVNCTEDFERLPDVIDGASALFVALWGDAGRYARSAVGMQQLHYGMAIEIEGVFEIDPAG